MRLGELRLRGGPAQLRLLRGQGGLQARALPHHRCQLLLHIAREDPGVAQGGYERCHSVLPKP